MIMKKGMQKRSRLRRCGRLNKSHFLLLGGGGGGGGGAYSWYFTVLIHQSLLKQQIQKTACSMSPFLIGVKISNPFRIIRHQSMYYMVNSCANM